MKEIITLTIWAKEEREPWSVGFDDPAKADAYEKKVKKMLEACPDTELRITRDSNVVNDPGEYLEALAEELEIDIPEDEPAETAAEQEETISLYVRYAVNGRYSAEVKVPRSMYPGPDASRKEKEDFIQHVKDLAEGEYCDADFGGLEVVEGETIYVEDAEGEFIEESGNIYI